MVTVYIMLIYFNKEVEKFHVQIEAIPLEIDESDLTYAGCDVTN